MGPLPATRRMTRWAHVGGRPVRPLRDRRAGPAIASATASPRSSSAATTGGGWRASTACIDRLVGPTCDGADYTLDGVQPDPARRRWPRWTQQQRRRPTGWLRRLPTRRPTRDPAVPAAGGAGRLRRRRGAEPGLAAGSARARHACGPRAASRSAPTRPEPPTGRAAAGLDLPRPHPQPGRSRPGRGPTSCWAPRRRPRRWPNSPSGHPSREPSTWARAAASRRCTSPGHADADRGHRPQPAGPRAGRITAGLNGRRRPTCARLAVRARGGERVRPDRHQPAVRHVPARTGSAWSTARAASPATSWCGRSSPGPRQLAPGGTLQVLGNWAITRRAVAGAAGAPGSSRRAATPWCCSASASTRTSTSRCGSPTPGLPGTRLRRALPGVARLLRGPRHHRGRPGLDRAAQRRTRPPRRALRGLAPRRRPAGRGRVRRPFRGPSTAARPQRRGAAGATRWRVAPGVTQETSGTPGRGRPRAHRAAAGAGLGRAVEVDTALAAVVGACDGDLTVGRAGRGGRRPARGGRRRAGADVLTPRLRPLIADGMREGFQRSDRIPTAKAGFDADTGSVSR